MPKIVDHEERRAEIVAATMRVVERVGLEGVTIREIAREAGCSTGILAHYFTDKADILVTAHRTAFGQVHRRIDAQRADARNSVELIRMVLEEAFPLDDARLLEARIDVSFWGLALHNPHLREVRQSSHDASVDELRKMVEDAVRTGMALPGTNPESVAVETVALMDGVAMQAVLFPSAMSPERQHQIIEHHLASFLHVTNPVPER
ncbi:TetR family transcriptional regulator C-terminal domain-containing protein [Actinocorallia sp. API 0066]|uniref:TetR/AcrR family transcriptional regulator n=1 Tax=Actinocorallia sp. API 0066 TaxID=2896846 RepID=UPI001E571A4D|nr:TetR family transcriptional regulator C-terminal domain-containing protein [Actinocorallia sp. API 0066]MCD0453332.1 TetR family transcriptional regulator C-terminal domain-containing protein [Actinocorallia sp. API 0066]